MNVKTEKIHKIIEEIDEVLSLIKKLESDHLHAIQMVRPSFKSGAKNLIHYGAFRSQNLKKLQSDCINLDFLFWMEPNRILQPVY